MPGPGRGGAHPDAHLAGAREEDRAHGPRGTGGGSRSRGVVWAEKPTARLLGASETSLDAQSESRSRTGGHQASSKAPRHGRRLQTSGAVLDPRSPTSWTLSSGARAPSCWTRARSFTTLPLWRELAERSRAFCGLRPIAAGRILARSEQSGKAQRNSSGWVAETSFHSCTGKEAFGRLQVLPEVDSSFTA